MFHYLITLVSTFVYFVFPESLGDCSFLNTCYHMDTCKYVHYTIDYPESVQRPKLDVKAAGKHDDGSTTLFPPQVYQFMSRMWVCCPFYRSHPKDVGRLCFHNNLSVKTPEVEYPRLADGREYPILLNERGTPSVLMRSTSILPDGGYNGVSPIGTGWDTTTPPPILTGWGYPSPPPSGLDGCTPPPPQS